MATIVALGNIGRDAEMTQSRNGTSILKFTVADNTGYGENKTTNWFRVVMFGARGEKLQQYLTKGTRVEVIGELAVDTYQKDGEAKFTLEIRAHDVRFAGSPNHGNQSAPPPPKPRQAPPQQGGFDDDDIPF